MTAPVLEISRLTKEFGGLKAIDDFSITVEDGQVHGLIGPNGAGKTTIFNNITGIYSPTKGSIHFLGQDITGKKQFDIARRGLGRTFQNIRLFGNLSVIQNIIIASNSNAGYTFPEALFFTPRYRRMEKSVRENALTLLDSVGLADKRDEKASSLPYGHQRRLEIARALALNPRLLLLDEPAAGMNAEESLALVSFIKNIKDQFGLTVLMIEHHMDVVTNLCGIVTVLNFGKTIAEGSPAQVKRNEKVVEAYLGGSI
jgi:branched-chain amino acid transport system ATP-binding protein